MAASNGMNINPTARIKKYVKGINMRSALQERFAFKLSFGTAFLLAGWGSFRGSWIKKGEKKKKKKNNPNYQRKISWWFLLFFLNRVFGRKREKGRRSRERKRKGRNWEGREGGIMNQWNEVGFESSLLLWLPFKKIRNEESYTHTSHKSFFFSLFKKSKNFFWK